MGDFNKKKVMEEILKDVPVKINLKKRIKVIPESFGRKKPKEKTVTIYAFYYNRGVSDSELKYDRRKNPIKTDSTSSIAEIYTGGGPKNEQYHKELLAEGNIGKDKLFNSGPWFDPRMASLDASLDPSWAARKGEHYSYTSQSHWFREHFNKVCGRLGYDVILNGDEIQITKEVEVVDGENNFPVPLNICSHIGITLQYEDPTLKKALNSIELAYQRVKNAKLSSKKLSLTQHV